MPPFVTIEVSPTQLAELQAVLNPKQLRQAVFQSVLRTTNEGRTAVRKRMGQELNVVAKRIAERVSSRQPTGDTPVGKIIISGKGIQAAAFKSARAYKRHGVTVQFYPSGPTQMFRHAFKATMRSGHVGFFLRKEAAGTKSGFAHRLPIRELWGPGILAIMGEAATRTVGVQVLDNLRDILAKNLASQVDRFTKAKS